MLKTRLMHRILDLKESFNPATKIRIEVELTSSINRTLIGDIEVTDKLKREKYNEYFHVCNHSNYINNGHLYE